MYCFGLAICTGASSNTILDYNLVRFWSMHDKTSSWENANCKMYLASPQKTELPPEKKLTPRPPPEKSRTPWQES